MNQTKTKSGSVVPPDELVGAIRALVRKTSESSAAEALGLGRAVLSRLYGGLPCRAGTIELARHRLGLAS